jgi:NAD(P)-dependent dehydrogenase (short-subunit alcohol dehydrogenase family)
MCCRIDQGRGEELCRSRFGQPHEIAAAVAFLASPWRATSPVGAVDGGMVM